jgi:hypothetical protein
LSQYKTDLSKKLKIQYFGIQNTISAILRKYQNISFFSSFIGFRPFQTHCTILCLCLPIEMTWNWVFLSVTGEKWRLCFAKTIWNQVFLSETGGKSRLCFGKMIWNQVFDMKKSWFMTIFIWIFIKKISILILNRFFFENHQLCILSYLFDIESYLIVSYRFLVLVSWSHSCLVKISFQVSIVRMIIG